MPTPIELCWRWSQLLVAIGLVIAEWICRGAITVLLRFIPVPWKQNKYSQISGEDPNCERGTLEYVTSMGYDGEEHFTTTTDGYIIGLHRVPAVHSGDGAEEYSGPPPPVRPVLIIHGFMHCSEAFIRQRAVDCLPLVLSDAGYDVWLGNNRGNKYSHKHTSKKPHTEEYWDFSMDDMARYDLPSMIDYILAHSGASSLTLIGFSQGTAQSFAYLSRAQHSKVNLFIALAPVIVPHGFANPVVDSLIRSRPDFIFLLFGKRQLLPSTLFWRNNLPRTAYVQLLDVAVKFLFGWDTACLSKDEKPLLYSHIYSHASVKTVVQWFQIIQSGKFQMFDDDNIPISSSNSYPGYVLPSYQIGQIRTPVACFCGGRDTLPHTSEILDALPKDKKVFVHIEKEYEHLDFMWAKDAAVKIYPKILDLMDEYSNKSEACEL